MSIIEALNYYRTGRLIMLDTAKLQHLLLLLDGKIDDMQKVVKSQNVAQEVRDDLREYYALEDEVKRLLEARSDTVI